MEHLIRLFKAVEIKSVGEREASKDLLEKTIKNGFIFSPEVIYNYSDVELESLADLVGKEIGLTLREMNNAFHKSWGKVKEAKIEQLIIEQLIHYFTTYGFKQLGIFSEDSIYIPNEKLELPEVNVDNFVLNIIKGYTIEEIKEKVIKLLKSGIALKEDTMKDVVEVAKYVGIGHNNVDDIKNKEVKTALCDHLGLFPKDPVEFLRYVIYKTTNRTLLIKDIATIGALKEMSNKETSVLFMKYKIRYGLQELSKIFHRFKPIFLAMKSEDSMKMFINRIRKLAVKYHKPMNKDYLNEITAMIKNGEAINKSDLERHLDKASPFRKVRLAYALNYRITDADSILYKIRNGKGFATDFSFTKKAEAEQILDLVLNSFIRDIGNKVKGKKIFIPNYIQYALPTTEKQFVGNFPCGTCITVPKDMLFGIHWNNVDGRGIDLDLSLMNTEIGKIGWDSSYRTEDRTILFSGDMTDAGGKHGASELFYVKRQAIQEFIMFVNYYNYMPNCEVPFDIIVAKENVSDLEHNYLVNPDNVIATAETKINKKQKMLGLLVSTFNRNRFYFSEADIGKSITSGNHDYVKNSRKYLVKFNRNTINLNDILVNAGATLTQTEDECDINLAPKIIGKDTIIELIT